MRARSGNVSADPGDPYCKGRFYCLSQPERRCSGASHKRRSRVSDPPCGLTFRALSVLDQLDATVTQLGTDEARRALEEAMRTIAVRHGATHGTVNFLPDRAGFFYKGPDEVAPVQVSAGKVTAADDPG